MLTLPIQKDMNSEADDPQLCSPSHTRGSQL